MKNIDYYTRKQKIYKNLKKKNYNKSKKRHSYKRKTLKKKKYNKSKKHISHKNLQGGFFRELRVARSLARLINGIGAKNEDTIVEDPDIEEVSEVPVNVNKDEDRSKDPVFFGKNRSKTLKKKKAISIKKILPPITIIKQNLTSLLELLNESDQIYSRNALEYLNVIDTEINNIDNLISNKIGGVNTNPLEKISNEVAGDFRDAERVLKPPPKYKGKKYTKRAKRPSGKRRFWRRKPPSGRPGTPGRPNSGDRTRKRV